MLREIIPYTKYLAFQTKMGRAVRSIVIPATAGIHGVAISSAIGSRLRGSDVGAVAC